MQFPDGHIDLKVESDFDALPVNRLDICGSDGTPLVVAYEALMLHNGDTITIQVRLT
jgi:hypothetical protein